MSDLTATEAGEFQDVRAHYDLGNAFYKMFLDPSMTYSCAKFDSPERTLAEAQRAKIDYTLDKCELAPGHRLLDVGCGWGATVCRARQRFDITAIGLTVSRAQHTHNLSLARETAGIQFRCEGWETFEEPVDRIISIGAFEHFGRAEYSSFFQRCRSILPSDGLLVLHTITFGKPQVAFSFLRFIHFVSKEIFPGGDIPNPERVVTEARAGGFELVHVESLRPHYARTLDCWSANLMANRERATFLMGEQVVTKYMRYMTQAAQYFRSGECNVHQFKLRVA
jgi:cyclopropane-fatty-acyl-phospholipid synthase